MMAGQNTTHVPIQVGDRVRIDGYRRGTVVGEGEFCGIRQLLIALDDALDGAPPEARFAWDVWKIVEEGDGQQLGLVQGAIQHLGQDQGDEDHPKAVVGHTLGVAHTPHQPAGARYALQTMGVKDQLQGGAGVHFTSSAGNSSRRSCYNL